MADVNIQQTPQQPVASGGGSGAVWAIVVLVLVAILAWFLFSGGLSRNQTDRIDINVSTPAAPSGGGGGGGDATGGGGGTPPGGGAPPPQ